MKYAYLSKPTRVLLIHQSASMENKKTKENKFHLNDVQNIWNDCVGSAQEGSVIGSNTYESLKPKVWEMN